ncbi:MAG: alpha/beta fold hydrolase, partial [Clostridia bacterium]|nr:alpha/beta fold hydrolase [Clostridia bacterium]
IGPGHTAYMAEINRLCKAGYRVLTLDYTGCDKSEGENLNSINQPTKDVNELLKTVDYSGEIIVVGHSLGGYTTLNTLNLNSKIRKGVVISGFFSFKKEVNALFKIPFLSKPAIKYESDKCQNYSLDNFKYLKTTDDKILFIHSTDDKIVPYKSASGFLKKKINNKNISYLVVSGKGHNPNYTVEAIKYMNNTFAEYGAKIKSNELKTFEEKVAFMSDKSALKMTIQDDDIWEKILDFLS